MPDLTFKVLTAEPEPFAVGPLLRFKLHVSQSAAAAAEVVPIHSVALQCQIRLEPARRHYAAAEQEKLLDLFDRPSRWGQTLRPLLWTHASVGIGPFTDSIVVDLPVPCTYDFNLAVTKYFYALEDGEIPVNLLFSGTMFHEGEDGALQVAQIPWDREAFFRLPVPVWKKMMEQYYPNSAWLCLRKDVFDRLYEYKSRHGLPTWEQALESLLGTPENGCAARADCAAQSGEFGLMNQRLVDQIVDAVLYEGYILYPYRPSVKNRQRWTFGGLYPRAYCGAQQAGDAWSMLTECLVRGTGNSVVRVEVRFLHLQARLVGQLEHPVAELPDGADPVFRVVEELKVGDRLLQTWQEAVQREVILDALDLASLVAEPRHSKFTFPAGGGIERVRGHTGEIEAILLREQRSVTVRVQVAAQALGGGIFKLVVRIENDTPFDQADQTWHDEAVLHALASTHTILGVEHGEFLSLIDPPEGCRALAATCRNEGTWPVKVGREGENDTMLSSPITLYDYPQIAAESPGDFFDGTEIDEMLVLRILTLTDEEKLAAAAVDERVRALLNRTSSLSEDQMMGLHGIVRGLRPVPAGESP